MASRRGAVSENRYPPYEAKLDAAGITYRYVASVPLDDITRYADTQARLRIAGTPVVNQYAEKMKQGELFPPLIIWENDRSDYCLLDGNTREMAYRKRGQTHTDAYIVTNLQSDNEAIYVSSLFNAISGTPLAKDEIIRAIRAAQQLTPPMKDTRIAKDLGVSPSRVSRITSVMRFDERSERLGLATELPEDIKVILAPVTDDAVLADLHSLMLDADLKARDIKPIIKDIGEKGSEAERLQVVADERIALAPVIHAVSTGRTTAAPPARDSLMAFGRLYNLQSNFPNPADFVPVRQDTRDDWYPKLQEIHAWLATVITAYDNAGVTQGTP